MLLFFFVFGLFVGSFLNILVDRIPRGEAFVKGHSHCEFCKKNLKWYDLIPVFSFVFLQGKCRYCKHPLSFYYPIIETFTGILFALTFLIIPFYSIILVLYNLFIVSCFIVIFFSDLKSGIIPDKILLPAVIITFPYLLIVNPSSFIINLFCGLGALFFFFALFLITKGKGMGLGDVKLAFLLGLVLGFPAIILALYLAFLTGAIVGIILIIWRKKRSLKETIPFGPFLITGTIIGLFFGDLIIPKILIYLGLL